MVIYINLINIVIFFLKKKLIIVDEDNELLSKLFLGKLEGKII